MTDTMPDLLDMIPGDDELDERPQSTVTRDEANALKNAGQSASMADLSTDEFVAFLECLLPFRPGDEVSANDTYMHLDRSGVPAKARGGLWRTACAMGILRPRLVDYRGQQVHFKIPSTNPTNKSAYVGVYIMQPAVGREGR